MADPRTFLCSVVTPERAVLEADATFAALPAWDGEVGILHGHSPLVTALGVGRLRVQEVSGDEHVFLISAGVAEMVDNRLTILTERALAPDELDRSEAKAALEAALQKKPVGEAEVAEQDAVVQWARATLRLTAQS